MSRAIADPVTVVALPGPTKRADTRNANQCATASPTVAPQMILVRCAWVLVPGNAVNAASRQIATYSAIV
jgi:hypothetical protein